MLTSLLFRWQTRQLSRRNTTAFAALVVIAAFCAVIAYSFWNQQRSFSRDGVETEAVLVSKRIVEKRERSSSTGTISTVYEPTISFRYDTPEGPFRKKQEVSRSYYDSLPEPGGKFTVLYLPDAPDKVVSDPRTPGGNTMWAGLLAVLFLLMAVWQWRHGQREARALQAKRKLVEEG